MRSIAPFRMALILAAPHLLMLSSLAPWSSPTNPHLAWAHCDSSVWHGLAQLGLPGQGVHRKACPLSALQPEAEHGLPCGGTSPEADCCTLRRSNGRSSLRTLVGRVLESYHKPVEGHPETAGLTRSWPSGVWPVVDHGQKHEPGDATIIQGGLTLNGPLQRGSSPDPRSE